MVQNYNAIGIDDWAWLAIKYENHDINVGDTFQMSTMVHPFIDSIDISAEANTVENFTVRLATDVCETHRKLLEMYYRGTGYKGTFSATEFIIDLLTSPDWSFVLLLEDSDLGIINIRQFAENEMVDIDYADNGQVEITFRPQVHQDVVANDIRALNKVFNNDSLHALLQLIQSSIMETENLTV